MALPGQVTQNGASNYIFGTNSPNYDYGIWSGAGTSSIDASLKAAGVQVIRIPLLSSSSTTYTDAQLDAMMAGISACGAVPLCILPHALSGGGSSLSYNQHCVNYLGSRCNMYEFGNEPDLNGQSFTAYGSNWDTQIASLRSFNTGAAFIGPVLGVVANFSSYLIPWLNGRVTSGVLPDAVSFHDYPCTTSGVTQAQCTLKAPNIGNDAASLNSLIVASSLGHSLPICVTEWNVDAYYAQSYLTNSSFQTTFVENAIEGMISNGVVMACQFSFMQGLVNSSSPYAQQIQYAGFQFEAQKYLTASISVSPSPLSFSATQGGSNPASQNATLKNNTTASGSWTSSIVYTNGSGWLTLGTTSGTLASGASTTIAISCATGSLTPATYSAVVTFTLGSHTTTLNVSFTVSAGASATTPLSLYLSDATSTTLATANELYTTGGSPTTGWSYSRISTATGYGEVTAAGTTGAWAAGGSIGAPTGKGFFLDSAILVGKQFVAGNWSAIVRLNCAQGENANAEAGSITANIFVRVYKYNAGVYTSIVSMSLTSQTIPAAFTSFTLPATAGSALYFGSSDMLYVDIWLNITANTNAKTNQDVRLNRLSTNITGQTGDPAAIIVSPGYQTAAGSGQTLTASGGAAALLLRNNWTAASATITATLTKSDFGGLAFNVVNPSNFYEIAVRDASSPVPNSIALFKTVSGTRFTLTNNIAISFTRGTSHTVSVTTAQVGGSTIITVTFDGTQVLTYTDSVNPFGVGQVGLRNDVFSGASSGVYTSFSATSNDPPYNSRVDISIPSHNYLNNNNFNFAGGAWQLGGALASLLIFPPSGTYGSAAVATLSFANAATSGSAFCVQNANAGYGIPLQGYCLSCILNISQTFTGSIVYLQINFFDVNGNNLGTTTQSYTAANGRVSIQATAPAGTFTVQAAFGGTTTSATNSGVATFTAFQLEPMWFSQIGTTYTGNINYVKSYPTPICDFLQPDCATILDGTSVRFNRIFAGYISNIKSKYNGPNRIWDVECTSLAGYLETDILINASYTNMLDQQIIVDQIGTTAHLIAQTPTDIDVTGPDFSSANAAVVIPGQVVASTAYNDSTPREMLNDLQNYSNYIFGVDNYNNVFYMPQFFNKAPYGFSINPDNSTTFSMYDYELEIDRTQIRNCINVSGGTYQPFFTDTVVSGDGSHSQFYSGGVMDNFSTTYQGVTIPTVVANSTALVVGGPGALFSQGYTALYNDQTEELAFLNGVPTGQTVTATYQYNALVYVQVMDIGSILQYGQCWYKINDSSLVTLAAASARGEAEIAQYGQPRQVLKFKTQKMLSPGQVIQVTNPYDSLNAAKFTVQKVTVTWLGNNVNVYDVECGAYQPDLVDYVRNIHKAIVRGKSNSNAIIQSYVSASGADNITFSDSINIH